MKAIFRIFILTIAFTLSIKAQQSITTLTARFVNATTIQWQVPLPQNSTDPIEWQLRQNSFAKEGIRTFVGYYEGNLVGVLSVRPDFISGSVQWGGQEYLFTTEKGQLKVTLQAEGKCGVDEGQSHSHTAPISPTGRPALQAENNPNKVPAGIYSDSVLRHYRFALAVDYNAFRRYFQSNKEYVKNFWARAETFLNELYLREVGVTFTMVNDERLIVDTKEKQFYDGIKVQGDNEVYTITNKINTLIEPEIYDLGGMITNFNNFASGLASSGGAYREENKGDLYTDSSSDTTLMHEVGHLFGSLHTFTNCGKYTYHTEPGCGSSIMSYGHHYDNFFSLPSIHKMKEAMSNSASEYYTDKNQKGAPNTKFQNKVYGVETNNRAPIIDRSQIKKSYTIPPDTNFQFYIPATDPDGDPMLYVAHQADFAFGTSDLGKAKFTSFKFSQDPTFVFQDRQRGRSVERYSYLKQGETGEFTFWLGVNDGGYKGNKPHPVRYDVVETKLKVEKGTPFSITNLTTPAWETINRGKKITIHWGVDEKIFGKNSKVRILYSDDEGATFKYVLAESIPNNGKADVIFPVNAAPSKAYPNYVYPTFKIEVIDHIAIAIKKIP
ncbi:hypothetical protein RCZ04_00920 [Capnocytophaga sp. HP1101]